MPPYTIKQINDIEDFDPIVSIILGLEDEQCAIVARSLFRSPGTPCETDPQAAYEFAKTLLWKGHQSLPDSTWWLAVDDESGEPAGCCQWRVFTSEKPYGEDGYPLVTAEWCPEGEEREFCTDLFNQNLAARRAWMNIPHAELAWMCVTAKHRRRGVSRKLMDVGIERIDKLGLGAWLEATDVGYKVYRQYGYRSVLRTLIPMHRDQPSAKWEKMRAELLPQDFDSMWRPKNGQWTPDAVQQVVDWQKAYVNKPFVKGEVVPLDG